MKTLITTGLLLCMAATQAQLDSTMFGLSRGISTPTNPQTGYIYLAKVNTSNAVLTNVSANSLGTAFVALNQTIDNRKNQYYFVNGTQQLVKVDLVSGNTVSAVTVTNSAATYFNLITYHCADSTLYGLASGITTPTNPQSGYVYLASINPATGSVTNISPTSIANAVQMSRPVIDSKNRIFYFINGSSQLLGIDLTTGTVVTSANITNSVATNFSEMVYNRLDSTIYGLAGGITTPTNPATGYLYLSRINPLTGVVTGISAASIGNAYSLASTEIDPYNNLYYYINANKQLVSVSLASGTVQASNSIVFANGQYLDGMRYKHRVCTTPQGYITFLPKTANSGNVTAIREAQKNDGLSLFPNPAKVQLNVTVSSELYHSLKLMDITGRVVLSTEITQGNFTLDLANFADGIYTLSVLGEKEVVTKQVVISAR